MTYRFGISGVVFFTFGSTTSPIAQIPPPFTLSKQCANSFFTFPEEDSCEITDAFACPKPSIPSTAPGDLPRFPDCLAPHLFHKRFSLITQQEHINNELYKLKVRQLKQTTGSNEKDTASNLVLISYYASISMTIAQNSPEYYGSIC